MTGYKQINLNVMLNELGENRVKDILSDFSCPLNRDVEYFLHNKAIEFAKQGLARTHLIYASYKKEMVLSGYFTLTIKSFTLTKNALSKNMRKKVSKFGQYNKELERYIISAPLIGQLGKNYTNGYNKLITGDELLKMACDKISTSQLELGGKIIYLECEDKPELLGFYQRNGFIQFGERELDQDEIDKMEGKYLIQLLRYMSY
jgi:hypothetical protein